MNLPIRSARRRGRMLKYFSLLLLLIFPSLNRGQTTSTKPLSLEVGQINYFGYAGVDLDSVRARLPLSVGDSLTLTTFAQEQASISQEIQGVTGRPPTDLAVLCCDDHHHLLVYVGLRRQLVPALPVDADSARNRASGFHGSGVIRARPAGDGGCSGAG